VTLPCGHPAGCGPIYSSLDMSPRCSWCLNVAARKKAERERDAARKHLESLTPGGSEFAGDPKRCHDHVRERISSLWDQVREQAKRRKAAEADNAALAEAIRSVEGTVIIDDQRRGIFVCSECMTESKAEPCSHKPDCAFHLASLPHPGSALLARLAAARDVVEMAERIHRKYGSEKDWTEWTDLKVALDAYRSERDGADKAEAEFAWWRRLESSLPDCPQDEDCACPRCELAALRAGKGRLESP